MQQTKFKKWTENPIHGNKVFFRKARLKIILPIVSAIVLSCCSVSNSTIQNDVGAISDVTLSMDDIKTDFITTRDLKIMNGDHSEYIKYHNEFTNMTLSDNMDFQIKRNAFFYSFIMAELYYDTIAALDFTEIIDKYNVEMDSIQNVRYIKYLDMAMKSNIPLISFKATRKLAEIYSNGTIRIKRDRVKAEYYNHLCDSVAPLIFNH